MTFVLCITTCVETNNTGCRLVDLREGSTRDACPPSWSKFFQLAKSSSFSHPPLELAPPGSERSQIHRLVRRVEESM